MKKVKLFFKLFVMVLFFNPLFGQDYQAQMTNFQQVSESEFQFDIQLRNARTDPATNAWAYNSSQFQIDLNTAMFNGGQLLSANLTVDNTTTDLPPNQQLGDADFFYAGPNSALATNSPSMGNGSVLLLLDHGDWKTISRFSVKLSNAAGTGLKNWQDIDPEFVFRLNQTIVFSVPYDLNGGVATRKENSSVSVLNKTASDLIIDNIDRQLAGYWFSGDGNWADNSGWNNVTNENANTLPGANSNAIINGNCTIQGTSSYSLLPDGNGNGGELTVLTGPPPSTYTLTLLGNWGVATTQQIVGGPYNGLSTGEFTEGSVIAIQTSTGNPLVFQNWTTPDGGSFTDPNATTTDYTMPGNNATVIANWGFPRDGSEVLSSNLIEGNNKFDKKTGPVSGKGASLKSGIRDDLYASLTIAPGGELTVDKLFNDNINEAPAVLIQSTSDGTGSLLHDYDDVPATIQRYIPLTSGAPKYHLVSVPLTQASNPVSNLFLWSYLFEFNATDQEWVALGTPTNTPLNVDQGYMIYKYPGAKEWQSDTTYSFAGPINNGTFNCNVSYPDEGDNKSLVPNPYASAIDWDFITSPGSGWTKDNIYKGIWIWSPSAGALANSGNYATYIDGVGTLGGSRYIPVGQSFFVSASAANPDLSMTNDVRVHNSQAFLKTTDDIVDVLRINTFANESRDEIVVRFLEESTTSFDGEFDITKFYGPTEVPQLFTTSEDSKNLTINSIPFTPDVIVIPMSFKLGVSGLCTLEASSIESFDPSITIFLEDLLTGDMIDLRLNPEYSFFHDPDNDPMRFKLIFNGTTTIAEEHTENLQAFYADGSLFINMSEEHAAGAKLSVYNVNGQLEMTATVSSGNSFIRVPGLSFGVYMVQVVSNNKSVIRKIMVK